MDKEQAIKALHQIVTAIVETVKEAGPEGAPAGPLYLATMHVGMTHLQFESLMSALVQAGKLRKSNHCYFAN